MNEWDYIIVGAGTAGCVLANRLSADPKRRVLLIEAGTKAGHPLVTIPKGFAKLPARDDMSWRYVTERQAHRGREAEVWPRGKLLGGSSAINGMIHIRGQASDYDRWAAEGCTGWGWADMLRCFRVMEDWRGETDDAVHGTGGPMAVTPGHFRYPLADRIIAAGVEAGLPPTTDFNRGDQSGIGYYAHMIRDGRRESAASAFLEPVRHRRNLTILPRALVQRILFDGYRASGVAARIKGEAVTLRARQEVILSAGTFETPRLLQLSGIGPGALLSSLGIDVLHDNPAVGQHMRDHVGTALTFALTGERGNNHRLRGMGLAASVLRYALTRRGIMSTGPFEIGAFGRSRPDLPDPDFQLFIAPVTAMASAGKSPVGAVGRTPGLTVAGYITRPQSEGHVAIRSADPDAPLLIQPNCLSVPGDRQAVIGMVRFIRHMMHQPAIAPVIGAETMPGADVDSDDAIGAMLDRDARCSNHATSTCRMGSVVDPQLRVMGVSGLRIADLSVLPSVPSGNTAAPALAIGWRAAELIGA